MGLWIVRLLTEAHGGSVSYERADPGAKFVVHLPHASAVTEPPVTRVGAMGNTKPAKQARPDLSTPTWRHVQQPAEPPSERARVAVTVPDDLQRADSAVVGDVVTSDRGAESVGFLGGEGGAQEAAKDW